MLNLLWTKFQKYILTYICMLYIFLAFSLFFKYSPLCTSEIHNTAAVCTQSSGIPRFPPSSTPAHSNSFKPRVKMFQMCSACNKFSVCGNFAPCRVSCNCFITCQTFIILVFLLLAFKLSLTKWIYRNHIFFSFQATLVNIHLSERLFFHIGKFMQLFLVQLLHQWLMFLRGVADINPLRGRRFLVSFPV